MKGTVDYRYIMHLDCGMKRHTWVSFRELKYLCQRSQYMCIPQCWLTPISIYTVQSTLRLVPQQLHCRLAGLKWTLIPPHVLRSTSSPSAAPKREVMKGLLFSGAAARAELQLQTDNASTGQRICASAERQGDSEVLQTETRMDS